MPAVSTGARESHVARPALIEVLPFRAQTGAMGDRLFRTGGVGIAFAVLCVAAPSSVSARPGSFPHGPVDQTFTTKKPNTPTGASFTGVYHAANDSKGNPPCMRKMVFYPPRGWRYD